MPNRAQLLVVAYDLPPYLQPQAIQIGRLLDRLADAYRLFAVTADDTGSRKDPTLYAGLDRKFAAQIRLPYSATFLPLLLRKIFFPPFRMPDERRYWHRRAFRRVVEQWSQERFDGIVTFSYPLSSNLLGMQLKQRLKAPWTAFFSDPWVDSPYTRYRLMFRAINNALEKRTMTEADQLVFASREMHDAYVRKYPFIRHKASALEHSFEPGSYPGRTERRDGPVVFRYLGTLNRVRTPYALLHAVGDLASRDVLSGKDARFEFYGGTDIPCGMVMKRLIRRYGLQEIVQMKGSVPYRESLAVMQGADVLLVIDADIPGSVFLPSKLIDYVGAGRPVLGITPSDSASARVIRQAGGWVVRPGDSAEFARTLERILAAAGNNTLERHCPPRDLRDSYSIENRAKEAEQVIGRLILKAN